MKRFLPVISFFLTLYSCVLLLKGWYSPLFILFWILSVIFLILPFVSFTSLPKIHTPKLRKSILLTCVLILPILVRVINSDTTRMHQDEALLAYFSLHHSYFTLNFFSGIPQDVTAWTARVPAPFFILQKIFFTLTEANLVTIKLSILPYVFITTVMLYKIVKEILSNRAALVSVLFYSFLAPSIYFETQGIITNTASPIFLSFLYFLIVWAKKNKKRDAILSGILCALCYLFYFGAYIAFPILLFHAVTVYKTSKKPLFLKNFLSALFAFFITLGPFLTYTLLYYNYFTERINQVSLLKGSLSEVVLILGKNVMTGLASFTTDGIGGSEGFNFGHLALFDTFTRSLFIVSFLTALYAYFSHKKILFIFFPLFLSFLTMALSMPPPGYHRFILAYPLLSAILSIPFYYWVKIQMPLALRAVIPLFIFALYARGNQMYFQKAVQTEKNNEELRLSEFINANYPNRHLFIASFPGFAFEKIYFLTPGKNAEEVTSDYHKSLLGKFESDIPYVYVITFPKSFDEAFIQKDPHGKLVKFSQNYDLFVN